MAKEEHSLEKGYTKRYIKFDENRFFYIGSNLTKISWNFFSWYKFEGAILNDGILVRVKKYQFVGEEGLSTGCMSNRRKIRRAMNW